MSDHASSSENSRSAIERRLATRRKRARAMARARARSTHIIFVLIVGAGLLMVAPRYPGILVLIAPPFAIVLAWLIGSGVWRLGPLRRAYMSVHAAAGVLGQLAAWRGAHGRAHRLVGGAEHGSARYRMVKHIPWHLAGGAC